MQKMHFVASKSKSAQAGFKELTKLYGQTDKDDAEVVVALGGDGFMLQTIHDNFSNDLPIYGMNRGTIGFLMNEYKTEELPQRLIHSHNTAISPLEMVATDMHGNEFSARAINEVSLLRQSYQAAKLDIYIDEDKRMENLVCDGVMVATPAGSTAYNYSAHGPILPIDAPLMALTPVSPFRPRRWRGALLPQRVSVTVKVTEHKKRPVNAVADHWEVKSVTEVKIRNDDAVSAALLFDPHHTWNERILAEQFSN